VFFVPDGCCCRSAARLWAAPTKRWCQTRAPEGAFQHLRQTCRAGFVQFRHGWRSGAYRNRPQPADRGQDGVDHRSGDGHLGQLESDGTGVADDAGPDLDQLQLQPGQRPVCHGLGQFDVAHEGREVVGQRVQLQPHLVVAEPLAIQPRPAKGILSFVDARPGSVCLHARAGAARPCHADFKAARSSPDPSAGS
jgi:hypothetical protein